MSEVYDTFMVFELDDSGHRIRLDVTENEFRKNNGTNVLNSEQVVVIVKEDIGRIYIWKGSKSSVRKRFISSRIASDLQEELVKNASFHRCKIVSIDQGDELAEFLNVFKFKSMEVKEKLADMRYIRNVDRNRMLEAGIVPERGPKIITVDKSKEEATSPEISIDSDTSALKSKILAPIRRAPYRPSIIGPYTTSWQSLGLKKEEKIKEKILKTEIPKNCKRENLILGHTLYGAVSKTFNVLGKSVEETEWEIVKKVPKGMIEIDNHKLRVYFDDEKGIVEAVEILEYEMEKKKPAESKNTTEKLAIEKVVTKKPDVKKPVSSINYNSWTIKELRSYATKHNIKLPSGARKAEIIKIIKEARKNDN